MQCKYYPPILSLSVHLATFLVKMCSNYIVGNENMRNIQNFSSNHHVTSNPQTALTKQRESLKEPLKVFTLLSHQDCGCRVWLVPVLVTISALRL